MKFIGHLDIMRYFQKAIRRADIDIVYSEGYSPHQIMSFAAPLGVGITSDGEYFDIEVNSSKTSQESLNALNHVMVEGISVLEYKKLPDTAKTSMSLVAAADYFIYEKDEYQPLFPSFEELQKKLQKFFEGQKEIFIMKQTKKKQIEMNLKPLIYEIKALNGKDAVLNGDTNFVEKNGIFLKICTGSTNNIKPELVLEAFCKFCELEYNPFRFQIHRLEVYASSEDIPVKGEKEQKEYLKYLNAQLVPKEKEDENPRWYQRIVNHIWNWGSNKK